MIGNYLNETIVAGGGDPLTIGAESEAVYRRTVPFICEDAALSSYIPQLIQSNVKQKQNKNNHKSEIIIKQRGGHAIRMIART